MRLSAARPPELLAITIAIAALTACSAATDDGGFAEPPPDDDTDPGEPAPRLLALASDFHRGRISLVEVDETPRALWDMEMPDALPEDCGDPSSGLLPACATYEAAHRRTADGGDAVVVSWTNGESFTISEFTLASAPVERWRLRGVELRELPGPQAHDCEAEPSRECFFGSPHDCEVVREDASGLDLVVADTGWNRVLGVHLDPGEDIGVARWIIDTAAEGWPEWDGGPNDVDADLEDGAGEVRVSIHGGEILSYRVDPSWPEPELLWRFPRDEEARLNTPHGPESLDAGDGLDSIYYAHSDGLLPAMEGGTVGRMVIRPDGADYRYDLDLTGEPGGLPFHFPRSVDAGPEGAPGERLLLVAESGCPSMGDCEIPSALRVVRDPDVSLDSDLSGAISEDGAADTLRTPAHTVLRVDCDFAGLYMAHSLTDADLAPATLDSLTGARECEVLQ
ncbi:hypothetical protein L6R50_25245 [Myxococcota bacterium]|nr:hypothetical protein [Myxococcota bacterium]